MYAHLPWLLRASKVIALLSIASSMLLAAGAKAEELTLQDIAKATQALPQIVIYQAKEIVTLDPEKPTAQAVAVVGDRILATGTLDEQLEQNHRGRWRTEAQRKQHGYVRRETAE